MSWRRGLLVAGVALAAIAVVAAALLFVRSSGRATAIAQTSPAAAGHAPCPGAPHDQSSQPMRQGRTALDPRLRALVAVFRRAPSAADRSAMATCAAVESGVPLRFVRYVGRGILGGEMFVFPVPRGARPSGPASGGVSDGELAACLITVGGLPVAGQIDGCASLSDIRRPPDHWTAAEIFPGIGGPGVFVKAGVPPRLRHGSLLGSVVRDQIATVDVYDRNRIVLVVRVHGNAAYFHVAHSAPAAVHMRLVFRDSRGRVIASRHT